MEKGKIVQILGPVIDVEFETEQLPLIHDALTVVNKGKEVVMEVEQHMGNRTVRCILLAARLPYPTGKTTRKDENRLKDFCKACEKALKQIKEKHYDQKLEEEGYETILNYGIACYKKRCKVMVDK